MTPSENLPDTGGGVKPTSARDGGGPPPLRLDGPGELWGAGSLAALAREALPAYLAGRRWFGAKGSALVGVTAREAVPVQDAPAPAAFVFVEARTADGRAILYDVPMLLVTGASADRGAADAIARVGWPGGGGLLVDAVADDGFCLRLLERVRSGGAIEASGGRIVGLPTAADEAGAGLTVERGSAEQSHTTIVFGGRLLLKLFRRVEPGLDPDFELGRFLTARARFPAVPRTLGALFHEPADGPATTLAVLQEFVPNLGQGWTWVLDALGRALGRVAADGQPPPEPDDGAGPRGRPSPTAGEDAFASLLGAVADLGRTTGLLHVALASDPDDPAFAPEPLRPEDVEALSRRVAEQGAETFRALREACPRLPGPVRAVAEGLLRGDVGRLAASAGVATGTAGARKIRIHGDYHLGQVLRVEGGFVLLDFEGEPTRPLAERRAKRSPLRDVAGMLRSFDYAASAAARAVAVAAARPGSATAAEGWARRWRDRASAAFVGAYLDAVAPAALLPEEPGAWEALLRAFLLERLLSEVAYELAYRPDWVVIPLAALRRMADS